MPLTTQDFQYELPEELIAQHPCKEREGCRLMVLKGGAEPEHRNFRDILGILEAGTLLVLNDTKVVPARIPLFRKSGGRGEMLVQSCLESGHLVAVGRPSKRLKLGERLRCAKDSSVEVEIVRNLGEGLWEIAIHPENLWPNGMSRIGEVPLPPYIERKEGPGLDDLRDYQTVFSREPGSAAAPTASLHFSKDLLARLEDRGVEIHMLTHHVGTGTFLPVRVDRLEEHRMHSEAYSVPELTAKAIASAKAQGRPVLAVGTTVVRALESSHVATLRGEGSWGATECFIYPPYTFKVVDRLITNFHLPGSTLLMLVSALMGREVMLDAYACAVREKYRFFSYGDAMYLDPKGSG